MTVKHILMFSDSYRCSPYVTNVPLDKCNFRVVQPWQPIEKLLFAAIAGSRDQLSGVASIYRAASAKPQNFGLRQCDQRLGVCLGTGKERQEGVRACSCEALNSVTRYCGLSI